MHIVIPDDYQNAIGQLNCFKLLSGQTVTVLNDSAASVDDLAEKFRDADCLVLTRERTKITRELLSRLPKLKLISQTGKAGEHIDMRACSEHKVAVAEGIGSPIAPSELTWALIMASRRNLCRSVQDMKLGLWQTNIGVALHGQTLGIWGYGKIGRLVAGYGHAFGMKVLVWGGEKSRKDALEHGYQAAASRAEFFRDADVVSLHLRLHADTRGIVTLDDLRAMKSSALLVNTSRAELLAPGALETALEEGKPGFAALDVYLQEPIFDPEFHLLQMPNVICTPHLGYVEKNGYELYFEAAFKNVVDFFAGQPKNIANSDALA